MDTNTFATTVYAATSADKAFAYLRHLPHLDEWTLGSRMVTRIDDDTWMGTASGYQTMLCYHVRSLEHPSFLAIEWQCGYRWREYFKQYPVFVFPSRYVDPASEENGSYIHWISVIDPAWRTALTMPRVTVFESTPSAEPTAITSWPTRAPVAEPRRSVGCAGFAL